MIIPGARFRGAAWQYIEMKRAGGILSALQFRLLNLLLQYSCAEYSPCAW